MTCWIGPYSAASLDCGPGNPASVQVLEGTGVKLRCSGPPLTAGTQGTKTKATIKYDHVDGRLDKYLLLTQMTLEQQMNYICDKEANKAVERSIQQKVLVEEKQLLPR